jgi:UPF0755 protein
VLEDSIQARKPQEVVVIRLLGWLLHFLVMVTFLTAVVAGGVLFEFWLFLHKPGNPAVAERLVMINSGMGAVAIGRALEAAGVVADARKFHWLCVWRRAGSRLRAGEYAFAAFLTPGQVLDRLMRGDVVKYRVTLPEGIDVRGVARLLGATGLVKEEEILRLGRDAEYARGLGLLAVSLEGYLFPETYHFQRTQTGREMLEAMVKQFWLHFPEGWQTRARELGFNVNEIVTLASIVEKEAQLDGERPIIAAVFANRLRQGMPLQADPTAVYDLPGFAGPITPLHLLRESAYNTYRNLGLPPGPICNPGAKSIHAVLYPADVPYLYFVSNADGTHLFSETLTEHNAAVRNYRRRFKEAGSDHQQSGNTQ